MQKIFLYGPMGSGKSTVGRILAKKINAEFLDLDAEVEAFVKAPISKIISEQGESEFRKLEAEVLARVCRNEVENPRRSAGEVIALGGGSLLDRESRIACESVGQIVFLDVDYSTLVSRLAEERADRPLLQGNLEARLANILEQRKEHYVSFEMRIANKSHVLGDNFLEKTPEQIAWDIQHMLGRFHVRGMGSGYDVIVEPDGILNLGKYMLERNLNGPIAIVCDDNVAQLHAGLVIKSLEASGYSTHLIVIPAGEQKKNIESVSKLWKGFLFSGLDRKSTVVALGGGVVSDLAGFAAATFMRGCPWVVIPTTLLSMVDASLGGKTGFDMPEGKNLVGAFHSPRLVLADPNVLRTLPDEEFRSGLAEVIKHGIISDPTLFESCGCGYSQVKEDILRIVRKAIGVKVQIIELDPYEAGVRAALNLGHTVGHAIEIASNFQLRHGEAVAIGMMVEATYAEKVGLAKIGISEKIKNVLKCVGLPTEIPSELDKSVIIRAMRMDKKKDKSVVKFSLPLDIGCVQTGIAIDPLESVL